MDILEDQYMSIILGAEIEDCEISIKDCCGRHSAV